MNISVPARLPRWNGLMYSRPALGDLLDPNSSVDILPVGSEWGVDPSVSGTLQWFSPTTAAPVTTTPSTSGVNNSGLTSSVLNQLVQGGLQIGKMLTAQQTPAGQQLVYDSQGQLVSASTQPAGVPLNTTAASATIAGLNVNMLLLLGGAALVVMMLAKR